jgi:glycosyltransferase involved in cell wall biosynthesis
MTRIAIQPVMAGRAGGGPETYERELIRGLAALDPVTDYRLLTLSPAATAAVDPGAANFRATVLPGALRPVQMALGLPWEVLRQRVSLLHAAYIAPPASPVPYLFTLHCSSPFLRPEWFPPAIRRRLLFLIGRGMRAARHILCVSQHVKDMAVAHYGVDPGRLSVVHNGVGAHFRPLDEEEAAPTLARYGITAPYVFCAARFEKRKNLPAVLAAFARHRARGGDPALTLVLAGDMSWERAALDAQIDALGLRGAVRLPGYIPNADLPAVYSRALFFAYPSLWEGFGIPVLEAMACGTPVLSSATTSIPEVAGKAALLVDPASQAEVTAGFARLAGDATLRARLAAEGPARAGRFSWAATAQGTLDAYRRWS